MNPSRIPTDTSRVPTLPMRGPDNPYIPPATAVPMRSASDRIVDGLTTACFDGRISQDAAAVLAALVRLHERGGRVTDPEYAALGASVAASVFRGAP